MDHVAHVICGVINSDRAKPEAAWALAWSKAVLTIAIENH